MALSKFDGYTIHKIDEKPVDVFIKTPTTLNAIDFISYYRDNDYCLAAFAWLCYNKMDDSEYKKYSQSEKQTIYNFEMNYCVRALHNDIIESLHSFKFIYVVLLHMMHCSKYYNSDHIDNLVKASRGIVVVTKNCSKDVESGLRFVVHEQHYARKIIELLHYSNEIKQTFGDKFKEFENYARDCIDIC